MKRPSGLLYEQSAGSLCIQKPSEWTAGKKRSHGMVHAGGCGRSMVLVMDECPKWLSERIGEHIGRTVRPLKSKKNVLGNHLLRL